MTAMRAIVGVGLPAGVATASLGAALVSLGRRQFVRTAAARLDAGAGAAGAPAWFERVLAWLAPGADPGRAGTAVVLAGSLIVAVSALAAPVPTGALALVGAVVVVGARRRLPPPVSGAAYEESLVACLTEMQASLVSGSSLRQAVGVTATRAGPAVVGLADVDRGVVAGRPLQQELDRWAAERPDSGAPMVADALAIAGSTGASQALAIGAVIATLRRRQAQAQEVRALASQARASAVVLVALPLAFAMAISVLDPRVGRFLFLTPFGWACLLGGLGLDTAGAWWMSLLVRRVR